MKLYITVKCIHWETLHVCKLLFFFWLPSAYTQPINKLFCWFLNVCHKILEHLSVMGKNGVHIRIQQDKNYLNIEIKSCVFFTGKSNQRGNLFVICRVWLCKLTTKYHFIFSLHYIFSCSGHIKPARGYLGLPSSRQIEIFFFIITCVFQNWNIWMN